MKYFALLLVCLFAAPAMHASSISPLTDGFTLTVDNTVLSSTNTSFNSLTGVLSFSDSTSTYTFAEASAAPLLDALSVTRTCVTLNMGGCSSSVLSISNANFLNGAFQASAAVGVSAQASAQAGVSNLLFASSAANVGAESVLGGYSAPALSTTPEPSSLLLLGTGLLGVAGAARRRLFANAA